MTDNSDPLAEPLWDIAEVAAFLKLKPETVEKLARARRIPHLRPPAVNGGVGPVRFVPAEIRALVAASRVEARAS